MKQIILIDISEQIKQEYFQFGLSIFDGILALQWEMIHNISMRTSQQQQPRTKSQQKSLWKLPYLNQNNNMPIPLQTQRKKHSLPRHRFDLNTNFASIPRYSALQDKNLAYFFDKTKNRRIVENLRQEQDRKRNKKGAKTQREQRLNREVSQTQFADYLHKMKEKAKERKDLP